MPIAVGAGVGVLSSEVMERFWDIDTQKTALVLGFAASSLGLGLRYLKEHHTK